VITLTADSVVLDIGYKTRACCRSRRFRPTSHQSPATRFRSPSGARPEGYYELTRGKVERPTDWASLEKAFAEKSIIVAP